MYSCSSSDLLMYLRYPGYNLSVNHWTRDCDIVSQFVIIFSLADSDEIQQWGEILRGFVAVVRLWGSYSINTTSLIVGQKLVVSRLVLFSLWAPPRTTSQTASSLVLLLVSLLMAVFVLDAHCPQTLPREELTGLDKNKLGEPESSPQCWMWSERSLIRLDTAASRWAAMRSAHMRTYSDV